jgi:HEAT repeat protein
MIKKIRVYQRIFILIIFIFTLLICYAAQNTAVVKPTSGSDPKRQSVINSLRGLQTAFASYFVDFDTYPKNLVQLTTPIAYLTRISDEPNGGKWLISYAEDSMCLTIQSSSYPEYTSYLANQKLLGSLPTEKLKDIILYDNRKEVRDFASYTLEKKIRKDRIAGVPEYFLDLALKSSDTSIRINAIDALTILANRLVFPDEYQNLLALLNDLEPEIRITTIHVFGEIISHSNRFNGPLQELVQVLANDSTPSVRAAMIQAVSNRYIKGPNRNLIIYSLTSSLFDPEISVRTEAVKSLEQFNENNPNRTQIIKRLMVLIKENYPEEQIAVIQTLGTYRATESTTSLLPFLSSVNKKLKNTAISSLCKIGEPDTIAPMKHLLGSEFNTIRISLIQGLSKSSNPKSVELLAKWLHDPDPDIRETVIASLRKFDSIKVKPLLLTALQDTTSEIRVAAADALNLLEPTFSSWDYLKKLSLEDKLSLSRCEFSMMRTGLEAYMIDNGRYPPVQLFPYTLTTPVAYIPYIPLDPYHEKSLAFYRYYTPPSGQEWMVASDGPDQITDIDLSQVHYNPFQSDNLKPYNYDPTNGMMSKGDLWHQGP